jgi:pimeloyl-ACP methyl ester carboxylesterase
MLTINKRAVSVLAILCAVVGFQVAPAQAEPPAPVALIIPGQAMGSSPYALMAGVLQAQGYEPLIVDVPGTDLVADAQVIAHAVRGVGDRRIALIGHSVGGLSARYYLKALGGSAVVDQYIAIGTAQYGIAPKCIRGTEQYSCFDSDFLRTLNDGDDTPGPTRYNAIRSDSEYADGRLDGGQCRVQAPVLPGLDWGANHALEPLNPAVLSAVSEQLAGGCPGSYVASPEDSFTAESTILHR